MKTAINKQSLQFDLQKEYERLVQLQSPRFVARKYAEEDYTLTCGTCAADYEIYARAESEIGCNTNNQNMRQYIQKTAAAQTRYEDVFSKIEKLHFEELFLNISARNEKYHAALMTCREAINEARRKYEFNKRQLIEVRNTQISQSQTKYNELLNASLPGNSHAETPADAPRPVDPASHKYLLDEAQAHFQYARDRKNDMNLYAQEVKKAENKLIELVLDLAINRIQIDGGIRPKIRSSIDVGVLRSFVSADVDPSSLKLRPLQWSRTSAFGLYKFRRVSSELEQRALENERSFASSVL